MEVTLGKKKKKREKRVEEIYDKYGIEEKFLMARVETLETYVDATSMMTIPYYMAERKEIKKFIKYAKEIVTALKEVDIDALEKIFGEETLYTWGNKYTPLMDREYDDDY